VANLFVGQVLFEAPDIERFIEQGKKFGYNIDEYIAAVQKVPIVSEKKIKSALGYLSDMTNMLAEQGLASLYARENLKRIRSQHDLSRKLSKTNNLNEALDLCLKTAIAIATVDSGGIYLIDETTDRIELKLTEGLSPDFIEAAKFYEAGSDNARIIQAGNPLYLSNEELKNVISEEQKSEGLRSLAILPVQSKGRSIACINIASHHKDEIPEAVRDTLEITIFQIADVLSQRCGGIFLHCGPVPLSFP